MNTNVLDNAALLLSRIQGVGSRSSKRILLDLMKKKDSLLQPLIQTLQELSSSIVVCENCFNIDVSNPCSICSDNSRNKSIVCVVEDLNSLWAIERTKTYFGIYFVLGGTLSGIKYNDPSKLNIEKLIAKINSSNIEELIIATPATLEGQITANYIQDSIIQSNIKVSMLAQGIPIGGEIDYLDEITLSTALKLRKNLS